ncbi:MAG: AmmeMemoRadiSam system radical SAM enzyme [Myxococcota bacterium]
MQAREQTYDGAVVGEYWDRLEDGRVRCHVCPRHCTLHDGQRAFCFVREARDGQLLMTSYGRSTGFCIDPIEKKPLNHFHPGTSVLSFGTAGCNLGCRFCQNWEFSKARDVARGSSAAMPMAVADAAVRLGCTSMAVTYNDPVVFYEYAIDTAAACRERGVRTVAVTSGYIGAEARPRFFADMDAANVDLKSFSDAFYRKLCYARLDPVLETLRYLHEETDVWLEITTLLIPGHNDSEEELGRLSDWLVERLGPEVPLHFSAFHPDFKMRDVPPTPVSTLIRARARARAAGLKYVYTGNLRDREGQSTWCPGCGALLVERDGYDLGHWGLAGARCGSCGIDIPGRFDASPGRWGSARQPVIITP